MLLEILTWLISGVIVVSITGLIHLITAEMKGYKALEWWNKHGDDIFKGYTRFHIALKLIFGLLIWPVRVLEYLLFYIPKLYNSYEHETR